jgi:hypothetical protein
MSKMLKEKLNAILEALRNKTEVPENTEDTPEFQSNLKLCLYKSFLNSVIHCTDNRIILLGDGYVFNEDHKTPDILPYRSKEASVLNKDYPVKLKAIGDTVFIDSCTINDIEGTFYGAVCLNKVGLILYIPFNSRVSLSGDLNLI